MSGRGRKIAVAVVVLAAIGGVIYYLAPWQPAQEQQTPRGRRFGSESGPVTTLA